MSGFKSEVAFGLDNFQQPKKLSESDSIAQIIINLFLLQKGNMPSMPHIGIGINNYMYVLEEAEDVEELKKEIYNQCSELLPFISMGDVQVLIAPLSNGENVLLVVVPLSNIDESEENSVLLFGARKSDNNEVVFNYEFQKNIENF